MSRAKKEVIRISPQKRGRGRPRKHQVQNATETPTPQKRVREISRKNHVDQKVILHKENPRNEKKRQKRSKHPLVMVRTAMHRLFVGHLIKRKGRDLLLKNARNLEFREGGNKISDYEFSTCEFFAVTEIMTINSVEDVLTFIDDMPF
jgi:hypothetical protein